MARTFSISIVGAGNLASNLAPVLENAGHIINTISSLHIESARKLADSLYNTRAIDDNDFSSDNSEIILVAVKDDLLADICNEIIAPEGAALIHTSGFVEMDVFDSYNGPYGVFYPLQSFSKGRRTSFENIPICIESYDENLVEDLMQLGRSISRKVSFVSGKDRKILHLAAVFANNFVNHMLNISEGLLEDTSLRLEILQPLVEETVRKAFEMGPGNAQTGPAKRGDMSTIQEHLSLLSEMPQTAEIYELISKQILRDNL